MDNRQRVKKHFNETLRWIFYSGLIFVILIETACFEKQSEYFISRTNYDKDLDILYRQKIISEIDYLTYLHMGPQGLFINADEEGVTLTNLILTGYKPDSIRFQSIKVKDSISLDIEKAEFSDSLIIITLVVRNQSNKTIVISDFQIADILGSEVANIWYYESIDSSYIKPKSTIKLKDHYLPVVNDFFKDAYLNEKFSQPVDLYQHIRHVVWGFNYQIVDQ